MVDKSEHVAVMLLSVVLVSDEASTAMPSFFDAEEDVRSEGSTEKACVKNFDA